jgi:hypothetical protein
MTLDMNREKILNYLTRKNCDDALYESGGKFKQLNKEKL